MWFPFLDPTSLQLSRIKVLAIRKASPVLTFALQERWLWPARAISASICTYSGSRVVWQPASSTLFFFFFCNVNFLTSHDNFPNDKDPRVGTVG